MRHAMLRCANPVDFRSCHVFAKSSARSGRSFGVAAARRFPKVLRRFFRWQYFGLVANSAPAPAILLSGNLGSEKLPVSQEQRPPLEREPNATHEMFRPV